MQRAHKILSNVPFKNHGIIEWIGLEGLLKDYLDQSLEVVITALQKCLGAFKDMGTKILFYLQTDHFIFISVNHVTLPESTSHFIYQRFTKFEKMYVYIYCILRVFLVNLELIYYIIIAQSSRRCSCSLHWAK